VFLNYSFNLPCRYYFTIFIFVELFNLSFSVMDFLLTKFHYPTFFYGSNLPFSCVFWSFSFVFEILNQTVTKPFLLFVESLWSNTKMLSGIIGVVVSDCFKEDYPFEPKTTATGEIYQISNSASSRYFIRQDDRLSFECW